MNRVDEIRLMHNIGEFLNFYGAHPRILNSPRIEEWLKDIINELKIESVEDLRQKLKIEMGKIKYFSNGVYHEIRVDREQILSIQRSMHEIKNHSSIQNYVGLYDSISKNGSNNSEKSEVLENNPIEIAYQEEIRRFDKKGIEVQYEVINGSENQETKQKYEERTVYKRDSEDWRFFVKETNDSRIMQRVYFFRKKPFLLQNIKISREDLKRANLNGKNIEDLSELVADGTDRLIYEIVKNCNLASLNRENFLKEYRFLNRLNNLDTRYEKEIEKNLLGYIERN